MARSVKDEYDLGEVLGKGSFSTVHLGTHKKTGEKVAVKVINKKDINVDSKSAKRIQTEVSILTKVKHPNIVSLKDLFDETDNLYMIMELVTGGELFDRIVKKGQYSEKDACSVIKQTVEAINYLHLQSIAHRDLKPENMLVHASNDTHVMISDFGLSRIIGEHSMMNTACGTPYYVAPEVIKAEPYGKEVDMWSIGVITYFILCGFPPFMGESLPEIFDMITTGEFEFPSPDWDKVSNNAKDFVRKCLVLNPANRLTSEDALKHPWLQGGGASDEQLNIGNLAQGKAGTKKTFGK